MWAPNAERVSVVCNANHWDGRVHPMRNRGESGIWEIFLPEVVEEEVYKYEIRSREGGKILLKRPTPSLSVASGLPARGRSSAPSTGTSGGTRTGWRGAPAATFSTAPSPSTRSTSVPGRGRRARAARISPTGSWRTISCRTSRKWGIPTSSCSRWRSSLRRVVGIPGARLLRPDVPLRPPPEFMEFVDRCHREGIGVILDWVPAHFPRDSHGLASFDGDPPLRARGPAAGRAPRLGHARLQLRAAGSREFPPLQRPVLDEEVPHRRPPGGRGRVHAVPRLFAQAGRVDPQRLRGPENLEAIAFLKRMNEEVHSRHPRRLHGAEESTAWPAVSRPGVPRGAGFTLKWNMGWMHDMLSFIEKDPIHRKFHFASSPSRCCTPSTRTSSCPSPTTRSCT